MKKYPHLSEMGIRHPEQIESYMINGLPTYDVLRIIYARESGSLLPASRTYKFLRVQKEIPDVTDSSKTVTVMETNPGLRAAVDELKKLLKEKEQQQNIKNALLEQIALLEEDISLRSRYIRELVERL